MCTFDAGLAGVNRALLACRHPNAVLVEVKNYRYSPDDPDIENSGELAFAFCYAALHVSSTRFA